MKKCFLFNTEFTIFIILVALAVLFYILGIIFPRFNDLSVNLCAGCLTAIIVAFVVEYLRRRENKQRLFEVDITAKSDIGLLANMLISYMASPLGYLTPDYLSGSEHTRKSIREGSISMLSEILNADVESILEHMQVKEWRHFAVNISLIKNSLSEDLKIYGSVLPPEILGKILSVRKAFNSISDFSFALFIDLFTKEEEDWPVNKSGQEKNRELRNSQIPIIARDLKKYFSEVQQLTIFLNKFNFFDQD